jgi:hypothetical protein
MNLMTRINHVYERAVELNNAGSEAVLDPVTLAELAGFDPDAWQRDVLRSDAHQIIMLVSRQGGKSTVSSVRALHKALFAPGSLVLLLAPSYRQSKELFRKVKAAYACLPDARRIASESALEMEFANGSRIVALPGKEETIRGFSGVALLIVDEASLVPDALYQAIRPMLAVSGGSILCCPRRAANVVSFITNGRSAETVGIARRLPPLIAHASRRNGWIRSARRLAIGGLGRNIFASSLKQ